MTDRSPRILDVDALKALAHALRQQMLTRLQREGPATSADLAAEFGADRGATSYHLRQLERFGFVEEDVERSAGRRRYWRAVPQDLRLPRGATDPEVAEAARQLGRQWIDRGQQELHDHLTHRVDGDPFTEAAMHSYGGAKLTPDELRQFSEEYIAFLKRWQREPGQETPGSEYVTVLFHAFRAPVDRNEEAAS